MAVETGGLPGNVEAGDARGETLLEVVPPELAVPHDRQPHGFLLSDDLPNGFILGSKQLLFRGLAPVVSKEDVPQPVGVDQAADVFRP